MGDITELILLGVLCEACGDYIGEPVGYPRECDVCEGEEE